MPFILADKIIQRFGLNFWLKAARVDAKWTENLVYTVYKCPCRRCRKLSELFFDWRPAPTVPTRPHSPQLQEGFILALLFTSENFMLSDRPKNISVINREQKFTFWPLTTLRSKRGFHYSLHKFYHNKPV